MQQTHFLSRNAKLDKTFVSFPPINLFLYSITNFLFDYQLDIFATQTKMDEEIVNLSSPIFISIPLPFLSLAKDAWSDSTSVIFPFFPSKDAQLDKFATQMMLNEAIISLFLLVSLLFHHLFILKDEWLD